MLQAERHREKPYDQLVIETTGMANPLPIMQVFSDPELAEDMTLVRQLCSLCWLAPCWPVSHLTLTARDFDTTATQ